MVCFIDHIPCDFNSVNKTIKIPTIPSVVLDTDKTNDKHVTQTRPIEPTALDLQRIQSESYMI
jgi:hypothetical protein